MLTVVEVLNPTIGHAYEPFFAYIEVYITINLKIKLLIHGRHTINGMSMRVASEVRFLPRENLNEISMRLANILSAAKRERIQYNS